MAQTVKATISAKTISPAIVQVELKLPVETDSLSFRTSYASVVDLAKRISKIEALDSKGERVKLDTRVPGEFSSDRKVSTVTYEVDLTQPSRLEDMSHVSWLNEKQGLLMTSDLLPRLSSEFDVEFYFDLPAGWTISSNSKAIGERRFVTAEPITAVFLVGPDLREESKRSGSTAFKLTTSGRWPFSNSELAKIAQKIVDDYAGVTGFELKGGAHLMLVPFPPGASPERWTAEARGNTVVLLLGSGGSRKQLINRVAILLSHELFHVWVPNSLKLDGDYDWFFEGFTLYQALVADMRLGLISFRDFLETIRRVYRSYLAIPNRDRLSLIEASERRWSTSSSLVYDKGMLLAFIYDLAIRSNSNCRSSLSDVYPALFKAAAAGHGNANETIIPILDKLANANGFVRDYVEGRRPIILEEHIAQYGLEVQTGTRAKLSVRKDQNDEQRRLFKCIGDRK